MALQDELRKAGLDPNRFTKAEERVVLVLGTGKERLLPVGTKARPGTPFDRFGGRYEARTLRVFDEVAARNALKTYNTQTKQTTQAVNRLTSEAKGKSQQQKVEDFNRELLRAESSGFKINPNQKTILDTYAKLATISNPKNFSEAISNYSIALSQARTTGIDRLSNSQKSNLERLARRVRDFDSKDLGQGAKDVIKYIGDVGDAINAVALQQDKVKRDKERLKRYSGKELETKRGMLATEEDKLSRLIITANQAAPRITESLSRVGLADIAPRVAGLGEAAGRVGEGLQALSSARVFGTGELAGRLNSQLTDQQILDDINTARRNEYKRLYDIGTAATTDLQSQIATAQGLLPSLSATQRTAAQKQIQALQAELTQVQADTLQARNLFEGYQPVSGDQAATAISNFRESLRLPEQRTLDQIREIDPNLFQNITALSEQYRTLATTPLGPTTAESTEALRRQTEGQIAAQVALGSRLGAEEQRQYQQAARAAQTARGNVFGVAPAVEEAVTTGLAGEQRLAARLGAAQGFLSSGQSVSDALARDVSLRNALEQSRLGAAAEFAAAGPTPYNLAAQRAQQQLANVTALTAAARPATAAGTAQFQATPSAMVPYAYVNPQAGFLGAQNAANIYGSLADYQARTYGAQVNAISQGYRSFGQEFASIAGGLGNFTGLFGAPGSSAFFRA